MKKRCIHDYALIGTGILNNGYIQCDIVCTKCGKHGTVYAHDDLEKKILKIASSKNKKFRGIPKDVLLSEKLYDAVQSVFTN